MYSGCGVYSGRLYTSGSEVISSVIRQRRQWLSGLSGLSDIAHTNRIRTNVVRTGRGREIRTSRVRIVALSALPHRLFLIPPHEFSISILCLRMHFQFQLHPRYESFEPRSSRPNSDIAGPDCPRSRGRELGQSSERAEPPTAGLVRAVLAQTAVEVREETAPGARVLVVVLALDVCGHLCPLPAFRAAVASVNPDVVTVAVLAIVAVGAFEIGRLHDRVPFGFPLLFTRIILLGGSESTLIPLFFSVEVDIDIDSPALRAARVAGSLRSFHGPEFPATLHTGKAHRCLLSAFPPWEH